MTLIDDLKEPPDETEMTRRRALTVVGSGAIGIAVAGMGAGTISFLEPRVLYEEERRVTVGRPEDIAPGSMRVLSAERVYIVRNDAGFYALSAVCTHLGCVTRRRPDGQGFTCPCHGSRFGRDGKVEEGPAPRPLRRLHLELDRGILVVDIARTTSVDAILPVVS